MAEEKIAISKKEYEQYKELIKFYCEADSEYDKLRLFILKLHLAEQAYNSIEMETSDIMAVICDLINGLYKQSKKTDGAIRNRFDLVEKMLEIW